MTMTPAQAAPAPIKSAKRTRPVLLILLIGAALVMGLVLLDSYTKPVLVSGPMVQMPASGQLAIIWEMDAFWKTGAVQLQLMGEDVAEALCRKVGERRYEAVFKDLSPGTTYQYALINNGLFGRSVPLTPLFEIKTPIQAGINFRFIAFGDSGNGSNTQADLAKVFTAHKPDVVIHTGDLIYPAGELKDYLHNFYRPNAELIRSVLFMPCLGNHDCATDMGKPLLDTFVLPENGPAGITPERNYYFDFGDARFVALDSNPREMFGEITAKKRQELVVPWVRDVLTKTSAKWKFVYYHHPFYTGSKHPAEGAAYMKQDFVAVFEDCGVDVVFNGHNHLYERTAPIKQDKIMPEGQGILYIVTGAGGAERYAELTPPPYIRKHHDDDFSFTQVDLSPTRLQLKQIDQNDRVIDEYVIEKKPGGKPI